MFIPIGDENPTERTPFVNYAIIVLNVAAFLVFGLGDPRDPALIRWEMVPADLQWPTLFTNLFLHAGWMHLIGNMVFLWIFGDNVEDRLGHIGYVVFYFVCGLAADGAHIATNPNSLIPTLGASGAISGVMGAYVLFYPRAVVKTFVWLGIWYADVVRTPAYLWIGLWFVLQLLQNLLSRGAGGIAYFAHIGGFVAGIAIAGIIKAANRRGREPGPEGSLPEARGEGPRRPFAPIPDDPGIEWLDEPADSYSLLSLNEDPSNVAQISEVVSALGGEPSHEVARRLQTTRGMIARKIPRDAAAMIQRELQSRGIPSALILHNRANLPPKPAIVDGASWDDRSIRFRSGEQIAKMPWASPFLWVAARIEGRAFVDAFINRRAAYRLYDSRAVQLTEIDPSGRSEVDAGFAGFARAIRTYAPDSPANEGVAIAAGQEVWGRLDFPVESDYDDYVFWLYNLILARGVRA